MNKCILTKRFVFSVFFVLCTYTFLTAPSHVSAASISVNNIYNEVNQTRIQNNQPILKTNPLLTLAAERKAKDMITYGYWAHVNPTTGTTPWKFILDSGYRGKFAGENLAKGYSDTQSLISAWMASSLHKQNILSVRFQETGIAVVNGTINGQASTVIVQMFGQPRN